MQQDRPFLGLLLMVGFCVLAPIGDGLAKLLGQTLSVGQLVFVRFTVQAVLLLPFLIFGPSLARMNRGILGLIVLRTLLHIVGLGSMFLSLTFLPLADAIAIAFVMPFIMLILGHFILREEVGKRRMMACLVGFIGTLCVIQPNLTNVGAPALLPLLVAVVFSLFMLVTRQIAKKVDPIGLQAVSGLMATLLLVPTLWFGESVAGLEWIRPTQTELMFLLIVGVVGTLAHLLMTWSLRFAPSATVAPVQYLEIPFSTLIGWLFFRDLPNGLAAVGILITVSAGLYVLFRERAIARTQPSLT
jgi:drug/metabolite transporter (DMT)-like permease